MKRMLLVVAVLVPCLASAEATDPLCNDEVPSAQFLPALEESAERVKRIYCETADADQVIWAFRRLLEDNARWFAPFGGFVHDKEPLAYVAEIAARDNERIPTIDLPEDTRIGVGANYFEVESEEECSKAARGAQCEAVLTEFQDLYTFAHRFVVIAPQRAFRETLIAYDGEWKQFAQSGRGMTMVEAIFNGHLYKKSETNLFRLPPAKQFVVLHPVAVYEYLDGAPDGAAGQVGVALDVVGVNWWRQRKWYLPSGGAISTVYSDRPDVNDWGYGVSLYFRSVYTVGVSFRDGETGLYVSVDLLKLLQDNSAVLEKFGKTLRKGN